MSAFRDRVVTFIGRLEQLPLHRARRLVTAAGGILRRDLSRTADLHVVGHRAAFDVEHWRPQFNRAKRSGAQLISENGFFQLLGLCSSADLGGQALNTSDMLARSGLSAETAEILVLFDIIEPVDGAFQFRDLILARSIAHLLSQGVAIEDVVRDLVGRRRCFDVMPASLVEDDDGRIVIGIGATRFELDGQLRLPLSGGACLSAEALFDAAEAAEACGDYREAERLYRCCLDRNRGDWMVAFNLANVLQHLGRERESCRWLEHAVACRPGFADAWYNLGVMAARSGRQEEVVAAHFERALQCDPSFSDALYNLAALRFGEGRFAEAAEFWGRYLQRDGHGEWARKARHGLALCRQLAKAPAAVSARLDEVVQDASAD